MSRSQLKKYGMPVLPIDDNSDDEYEKPITHDQLMNPFAGLVISSSESEQEIAQLPDKISSMKSTKRERKKKNKEKLKKPRIDSGGDDIDRSVREVNEILGAPSCEVMQSAEQRQDPLKLLFSVKLKNLNLSYERLRLPTPSTSSNARKPFVKSHPVYKSASTLIKRNAIIPKDFPFKSCGLSMSIQRVDNGNTYFTFDHNREYQNNHNELLLQILRRLTHMVSPIVKALRDMHVEGMLEGVRYFCLAEDYSEAYSIVEKIIAYMLFSAHPSFNLTNMNMRLEYKYAENRAFHISVLIYIHFLTNKAYHKTALELAKMLLNLDPSDPLAIVFIIDILAIRAREYRWLINVVDFMDKTRDLKYMANIQFSYALAHFHIADDRETMKVADHLLKLAMMKFPSVLMGILDRINYIPNPTLRQHDYFNSYASKTTHEPLQDLIMLYAAFIGDKWKEPVVLDWLLRNAHEMIDLYDKDPAVQVEILNWEKVRNTLFKSWPDQIYRHLCIIYPLGKLFVIDDMPEIPGYFDVHFFNPAPPADSINRYKYQSNYTNDNPVAGIFDHFLSSLSPEYNYQPTE